MGGKEKERREREKTRREKLRGAFTTVMWEWDKIRKLQMCLWLGTCSFPGFQEHLEQEQGDLQV